MAHIIDEKEQPMSNFGTTQGPNKRYRRLRHPAFTADTWTSANPLLQKGEIGIETDTYKMKAGDGVTYWNDLPYTFDDVGANIDLSNLSATGKANVSAQGTYNEASTYSAGTVGNALQGKLNLDGTNTMTGVLKMRASVSFQCAIAPYWDGVGFYKLNDNDSVTLMASIESTTGFIPAGTNVYNIGSSDHKWKDLYLAGKAYIATINNGGDIDVPTKAGTMALESDIGRTNCITEIPQDINLELSSGTLTLKAGSKVYVPNGAGVFDVRNITSDATLTDSSASVNTWLIAVSNTGSLLYRALANSTSGAGATATSGFAYDTTANDIGWFTAGGVKSYSNVSFPVCICTSNASGFVSIDQVFNGFGYIGSTIFALPGVKGLYPNGRNTDGTLKNIAWTSSQVIVRTFTSPANNALFFDGSAFAILTSRLYEYKEPENINWDNYGQQKYTTTYIGLLSTTTGGVITHFNPKTTFHTVDYNDSDYIAHCAMPSGRYIDLTLGNSWDTYTMPADGYICLRKSGNSGEYIKILNRTQDIGSVGVAAGSGFDTPVTVPVSKGDTVQIAFNVSGATNYFRFVYANGSK